MFRIIAFWPIRAGGRLATLALCAGVLVTGPLAFAQTAYPLRPLHLVVPFPAGGAADLVARALCEPLAQAIGQPVVVDNKPGVDGVAAAEFVAKAAPDGYTLFMATYGAMSAAPWLHRTLPYDPERDFTPVAGVGSFSYFLFAHPQLPIHNVAELETYILQHPGQLNFGTGNAGALVLASEWAKARHLLLNPIPYKGEVPAMADFLAGRIDLMIATPSNTLAPVREGKLRALLAMQERRSALLPEVPSLPEADMVATSVQMWAGVFAPAGLPSAIRDRLAQALQSVLLRPALQTEFARQGFEPHPSGPGPLRTLLQHQLSAWQRAVAQAGLEAQ